MSELQITEIDGVGFRPSLWHEDDRGALREIWRETWPGVGRLDHGEVRQVYLSETRPGVVKAWHAHRLQTDRFSVVYGTVRLVLYDARPSSGTRGVLLEFVLSARSPATVTIPPGVVHGWICLGDEVSGVLNAVDREYDGTDEDRRPAHGGPADGVPYEWRRRVDG